MIRRWPLIASDPVLDVGIFRVVRDRARSPRTEDARDFHVIHMPDWIMVVPITASGLLVMVRQYRHASRSASLEVPGGLLDADDAHPEAGATRELAEETGYGGGDYSLLAELAPQPAFIANRVSIFVATNVAPAALQQQDEGEDIAVELVDPRRLPQLIAEGEVHNAMTVTALALAQLHGHLGETSWRRGP
jgi:8-oxo-dGTP pyrophosphatase MutT (NUDIX family)